MCTFVQCSRETILVRHLCQKQMSMSFEGKVGAVACNPISSS